MLSLGKWWAKFSVLDTFWLPSTEKTTKEKKASSECPKFEEWWWYSRTQWCSQWFCGAKMWCRIAWIRYYVQNMWPADSVKNFAECFGNAPFVTNINKAQVLPLYYQTRLFVIWKKRKTEKTKFSVFRYSIIQKEMNLAATEQSVLERTRSEIISWWTTCRSMGNGCRQRCGKQHTFWQGSIQTCLLVAGFSSGVVCLPDLGRPFFAVRNALLKS